MKRSLLFLAVLAMLAGACGSDPEPPVSANPVKLSGQVSAHGQKTVTGAKPSLEIEVEDDYFEPTFLKMDKQATISLKLQNKGTHAHTFTIDALRVDQMLAPGESKTLAFTLPAGSGANFYCKFHRPTGMQGAFYFIEGASFEQAPASSPEPTASNVDEGYNY